MIRRAQGFFRRPFGSALLGGAVVAAFGWIAIAAGWVDAQGGSTTTVAAPLAAPIASKSSGDTNVVNQIYRRDGQGVAFIQADQPPKSTPSPLSPFGEGESEGGGAATGSGFVIDTEGHVLTNNHVVAGANRIQVKLGASNTTYNATVVGTDPATDLALLKVDAPSSQLHPLPLGESSKVQVGDPVVAIGNPFGLDRTVTSGIVSALQRQIQAPNGFSISNVIQTDAAINPGNSGGPLIEAAGDVIGINSQIETGGGGNGNVGIGFAIPIDTARAEISQLERSGKVQHAFLGITGTSITPDLARAVNLPVKEGVLVQEVVKNGPANKAGIQGGATAATIDGANFSLGGDIITKVNGKKIVSMDDVVNIVNAAKPGETLELTVLRSGSTKTVRVTLGNRPASVQDSQSGPVGPLGK
ncbi:MAG TPA: trypsin-like peptidase domain-containing protein [Solirubrobacterales bacterium]|jgi:S1-C subfamily serine protease|nr:trypsin-like peptidase domain-containing protein [Solirubrobacterales bacterium]